MLKKIVDENWFKAQRSSASGRRILPATTSCSVTATCCTPCASNRAREGRANVALADFRRAEESGVQTTSERSSVTAGHRRGCDRRPLQARERRLFSIMVKALADRLAEAFAERMHQRVRKELWVMQAMNCWRPAT